MSGKRTKKSILAALVLWIFILAGIAATVKYLVLPQFHTRKKVVITEQTGSEGKYKHIVQIAADSFSGYSILRSNEMARRLGQHGIRLSVVDDGANYVKRMKSLGSGKIDMAVFPINSFIQSGAQLSEFPGSIVYIIDETKGADAIVARKSSVKGIGDLNSPDARIVLTPDSPSEFIARVMLASFSLPALPDKWMIKENGSGKVYKRFRGESAGKPYAYAMWEPDVSKALADPDAHVLIDSSKLKGYVIDVLVVRREFIIDNYDVVRNILEAHARTVYACRDRMVDIVMEDAELFKQKLTKDEAEQIVKGIEWKTTLANYAHFGLRGGQDIENIEDMIIKITEVLLKTGALQNDPVAGKVNSLYFNKILQSMLEGGFHPSREANVASGVVLDDEDSALQQPAGPRKLTSRQWLALVEVGELRVDPIQFGRGTSRMNVKSQRDLESLAKLMKSFPHYFLTVTGRVRPGGDAEEALKLAKARAEAAVEVLVEKGVPIERIRSFSQVSETDAAAAQSVSFMVGQMPY